MSMKSDKKTHAVSRVNPMAAYLTNSPYTVEQLDDPAQSLPKSVDTEKMNIQRKPLKAYFSMKSKTARCMKNKSPNLGGNLISKIKFVSAM